MSDWQPITTAPKDGTWIVLFVPDPIQDDAGPRPLVITARWVEERSERWDQVSTDRKERVVEDWSHWSCYETPTLWQPLPESPSH